jgi:aerobic carbon-monoxide dehydrogenase large subunit
MVAHAPHPNGNGYVGQPVRAVEAERYITGRAQYVDDILLPDMLHAAFLRSPHAHATLRAVDASLAQARPDVAAVLTGAEAAARTTRLNTPLNVPGYRDCGAWCLAVDKVRFVGEPIAIVAADSRYAAEDAAEAIVVEYDVLPAVTDPEGALLPDAPLLYPELGENALVHAAFEGGDPDGQFARADFVIRETFYTQRQNANPLETRGLVASYDKRADQLTVWASTQGPHLMRTALAEFLRFPENRIRVIAPDVGGGFGTKMLVYPEDVAVCLLALQVGRPVKWVEDRREHLLAACNAREQVHQVEAAASRDGMLLAIRDRLLSDAGAYSTWPTTGAMEAMQAGKLLPGPYRLRHYRWESVGVLTNKAPIGPYRAVSRPSGNFVIESLLERIAKEIGADPAVVRRKNLVQPEDFPYDAITNLTYDSGSFVEAFDRALEIIDYQGLRRQQVAWRAQGRKVGIGTACYTELSAQGSASFRSRGVANLSGWDSATVRVEPTGSVTLSVGVSSHGQSHETSLAQVAADELGVDLEAVTVLHGDTGAQPYGMGTWASRSAVAGGGATMIACRALKEKILAIAAHLLEAPATDLEVRHGEIAVRGTPERRLSFEQVARVAYYQIHRLPEDVDPALEVTRRYDPPLGTFSNGAQAALVEVDPETGEIKVLRYVIVEDCGRPINPRVVAAQVHGGAAQGLAGALYEEVRYDENGQLLSGSFMDYLMPTAGEVPAFELDTLHTPSPITMGGFKGMGEGGAISPPAVMANAVRDALAPLPMRIVRMPLTPERVLDAIAEAERAPAAQTAPHVDQAVVEAMERASAELPAANDPPVVPLDSV